MKRDWHPWAAAAAPGLALALAGASGAAVLALALEPPARAALLALLEPVAALVGFVFVAAALAFGALSRAAWQRWGMTAARRAEDRQLAVAAERERWQREVDARVAEGARRVEQERARLAALMAELQQSVVVCNLDGRILLYNHRARLQLRALSDAPGAGGAELVGIGRSIHALLDRALVAHALASVRARLARGAAHPLAQFITATRSGQLLRVQLAPVREPVDAAGAGGDDVASPGAAPAAGAERLNGYVLMLDNITRDFADESERDRLLVGHTEATRASLGAVQAAVELLDEPDLDGATRERLQAAVRDEVRAMSRRVAELAAQNARLQKTRWPLEAMQGADFLEAARRRIEAAQAARAGSGDAGDAHGGEGGGAGGHAPALRVAVAEVDPALWLKLDSYSMLAALVHLAGRLVDEFAVRLVELRLEAEPPPPAAPGGGAAAGPARARLSLGWIGHGVSTETVVAWETDAIGSAGGEAGALTVRDVVERHGGAFWFERERVRHAAQFRFLLPLDVQAAGPGGEPAAPQPAGGDSRPEFYDFDLFDAFQRAGGDGASAWAALAERRLAELTYTVFDTETTGLAPSDGDEIIQIGAVRVVAGKLRRGECFEQLVDPRRSLPDAGIAIHGITPAMLAGQPTIERVLPGFHAFAADSVLVAHNAAFDLRFLQIKEAQTGLRFEQPVLDTLLLSAACHPGQDAHALDAIAARLGVPVLGRHTALGDALVTAEVFLKLVPLLEARGIVTLAQALEASRKTWHARLSY